MRERPILFNDEMVRAILAGRKTQTRRPVKVPRGYDFDVEGGVVSRFDPREPEFVYHVACPFGVPGDVLYVRECFARYQTVNHILHSGGRASSEVSDGLVAYRADGHETIDDLRNHVRLMSGCDLEAIEIENDRWRPSIHMPRWASRLSLRVTDVRIERVQTISSVDALAEGISRVAFCPDDGFPLCDGYMVGPDDGKSTLHVHASEAFAQLWDGAYAGGDFAWSANPWVWAVSFEVLS